MKLSKSLGATLWLLTCCSFAQANNEREKAALVRLIHELQALQPLVTEARQSALMDARIRLNYDWLSQDLVHIQHGIQDYLDTPRSEPRSFPPLQGDYRQ